MSHQIEQSADGVASMAFAGPRADIWHRLGQEIPGRLMSASEAMEAAHMNRQVRIVPVPLPEGTQWAAPPPQYLVVLEGTAGVTPDGDLFDIPDKVVGMHGESGAKGHESLSIADRFVFAEECIHASHDALVFSTAGLLFDGTQGFACLEAPGVIIDPDGIHDIIRSYTTLTFGFNGKSTKVGASDIRSLCANTVRLHEAQAVPIIEIRHTAGARERMQAAAEHWAEAQDYRAALKLQGQPAFVLGGAIAGRDFRLPVEELGVRVPGLPAVVADIVRRGLPQHVDRVAHGLPVLHLPGGLLLGARLAHFEDPVQGSLAVSHGEHPLGLQYDGFYDEIKAVAAELVLADA